MGMCTKKGYNKRPGAKTFQTAGGRLLWGKGGGQGRAQVPQMEGEMDGWMVMHKSTAAQHPAAQSGKDRWGQWRGPRQGLGSAAGSWLEELAVSWVGLSGRCKCNTIQGAVPAGGFLPQGSACAPGRGRLAAAKRGAEVLAPASQGGRCCKLVLLQPAPHLRRATGASGAPAAGPAAAAASSCG